MLAGMRNAVQQGLTTLVFGAIIVVFALNFGPGSVAQCGGRKPVAATVSGRSISEAEFQRQYAAVFATRQQWQPDYSSEKAKAEGLKSTVLDQMIGEELLAQEAERRGLTVTPEELRDEIKTVPYFQTEGKFDRQKYSQYARYVNLTEAKFEEDYARRMVAQKMRKLLEDLTVVTPAEVKDTWENRNNRSDVEFVKVDPAFYKKNVKVSDVDVKKVLADEMKEVEASYNQHATRYNEPRKVRARHILAKVAESAPEADQQKAREKMEAAKARLDKGEDFATVAKEMSEDSSAASGGDLGLQGPGVWVKPFEEEASRLSAGKYGEIIRTRFGFHIIKVEEIKEAQKRTVDEVKDEIAKLLVEERMSKAAAKVFADKTLAEAKSGKDLSTLVPAVPEGAKVDPLAPKVETTGWFNKGSKYVPRVGVAADVVGAVFERKEAGLLDRVFEVNARLFVIKIKARELPDPKKFDEEREALENQLRTQMQSRLVGDFIKELRTQATAAKRVTIDTDVISYDARASSSPAPLDDF
jgi:peptidyl-prolyl cis-trans isomerase D